MDISHNGDILLINGSSLSESKKSSETSLMKKIHFTVIGLGSAGHSRLEAILSDEAEKCGFELTGKAPPKG